MPGARTFRIISGLLNEDLTRRITAFEYDPSVYETAAGPGVSVLYRMLATFTDTEQHFLSRTADSTTWNTITAPAAGRFWFRESDGATGLHVSGANVRRTADGGATWTSLTALPAANEGGGIILADGTILCGASVLTDLRIYRSTDGGATWSTITVAAGRTNCTPQLGACCFWQTDVGTVLFMDYRFDALDATSSPRVYRSTDGGATWTMVLQLNVLPHASAWVQGSLTYFNGVLFAIGDNGINTTTCRLYRSTDDGISWTEVFTHTTQRLKNFSTTYVYRNNPAPCPFTPEAWILATDANQWRSTNNGLTWTDEGSRGMSYPVWANGEAMFGHLNGAAGNRVAVSLDEGATWQVVAGTTGSTQPRELYRAPGVIG